MVSGGLSLHYLNHLLPERLGISHRLFWTLLDFFVIFAHKGYKDRPKTYFGHF